MKWYAYKNMMRRSVDLLAVDEHPGGRRFEGRPIELIMAAVDSETSVGEPTLSISHDAASELLQALWDAGFRPNNGEGGTAEAAALRNHIKFAEGVTGALLERVPTASITSKTGA